MTDHLANIRNSFTGAAQGIGLAIAAACLREAAGRFLVDWDSALIEQTVADLKALGRIGSAMAHISDRAGIEAGMAEDNGSIGPIYAVINDLRITVFQAPLGTPDEEWKRAFEVNVRGAWNCSREALPCMIVAGGGSILNIASTHSITIIPGTFPFPVIKHALLGLTKSLAFEFAYKGVRVNTAAPGYNDWWNGFPEPEKALSAMMALHPGESIATPEEFAMDGDSMISDETPFMTAASLVVDGVLSTLHHG